jgi:hypothetical protein
MTNAPATLLSARQVMLDHLDMHPGKTESADLDPAEVGIVGDLAHRGGYHCGRDRVDLDDYSVRESPRDKAGLDDHAAALDIGEFEVWVAGKAHNLRSFSIWAVAQCKANTPDSRDIREIIYTADGRTVRRWDRLGKRTTGDSSHLFHTHFSFFRDAVKAGRDQRPLFIRYLTEIGLLEGDDMTPPEHDALQYLFDKALRGGPDAGIKVTLPNGTQSNSDVAKLDFVISQLGAIAARVGGDLVDEPAIVAGILAGLNPTQIATVIAEHLPADLAKQVADELAARLAA